ncbi:hypothetical protein niasHS_000510 [Heterodera schachtii]|uniref:Nidogen-1 n=1 Tax=Heterodera schachtii TaxID=97005 RepID=A0ABD2K4G4_HETSC
MTRLLTFPSILSLFLLCLVPTSFATHLPYGVEDGDEELHFAGRPFVRQILPKHFAFFERPHHSLFISANGAVSFDDSFDPNSKELDTERRDLIAVFHVPSKDGKVFFRSSGASDLLTKELSAKIRRAFSAHQFEADAVVLVTWDGLGQEDGTMGEGGNTFQLALATDGNETYALLVYSRIRWVQAADGRFAQAGFFSSDGRSEKMTNSGSQNIGNVIRDTNFLEPGLFLYRISGSHPLDPRQGQKGAGGSLTGEEESDYEYQQEQQDYEPGDQISECPPDPFRDSCPPNCNVLLDDNQCSLCICSSVISENLAGSAYEKHSNDISPDRSLRPLPMATLSASQRTSDLSCTPRQGRLQCHPSANCIQQNNGYCCQCDNGFIGNGVECLAKDGPLRINGMFEAALNGKQMQRTDLFAYVQPAEGQQHTALAKVPPEMGWALLLLDALSTPFGWLFAKVPADAQQQNGFQLSGGNFTRIVNIHLGERYALVIRQEFADRQFNEHFSVNVFVSGTLPELRGPVQVTVPEFEETYRRERAGLLRAYSERHLNVRAAGEEETKFRVTTDQQIHFVECPHKAKQSDALSVVKFERLNANFNQEESVEENRTKAEGRTTDRTRALLGVTSAPFQIWFQCPFDDATFVPLNVCVPTSSSYRCECRLGFQLVQDNSVEQGITCQPIVSETSQNIEQHGTAAKQQPLQRGECTRHDQCHQWGECVFHSLPGHPGKCKCRGWYVGDGFSHCGPPEEPPPQQTPVQKQPKGTICRGDSECGDNAQCDVTDDGYWLCKCSSGFRGDGMECVQIGEETEEEKQRETNIGGTAEEKEEGRDRRKQCAEQADCHPNGHCVLDDDLASVHFCECLPGFTGDGVESCERSEECSPTDPGQGCADPSEECRFEHSLQKFACHCRSGFLKGSTGRCEYQIVQSADPCRQCGANAQCVKDAEDQRNCVCNIGFTGNGFECRRESNCLDDASLCSPNAQCLPDGATRDYLCVCNYGYSGDGRTCEAMAPNARGDGTESLLIGRGMAIIQRTREPNGNGKQLVVLPHQIVVDIEFDCHSERFFWSDISGHSIRSAFLNGTGLSSNFSEVLRSPEGIAIDWPSRNIYYVDSIKNELGVLSIDGRFQKALLTEGLNNPRALVIDLESRHLYYSDWSREGPKIGRVSLDGSANEIFISDDVHLPNGMVLLQQRRWLCWVDAGIQQLSCIGLDGTGRRVIYAPLEYPFGLTVNGAEERFYWTDWKDMKIHSVDVFGKGYTQFLPGGGGKGRPYGVLSLPTKCRPHPPLSECMANNGGCAHWCLSGARRGTTKCVCPDNVQGLEGC